MDNVNYKKVGIVFRKDKDGNFVFDTVKVLEGDSASLLDNSAVLNLDEEKYSSIKDKKNTNFMMVNDADKDYICLVVSESLYKKLFEQCKQDNSSDEECEKLINMLLEKMSTEIDESKVEKRGNLQAFTVGFKEKKEEDSSSKSDKKQLEMNGSGSGNSSSSGSTKPEVEKIDMSTIDPNAIIAKIKNKVIAQDEAVETIVNNIYNNQLIFDTGNDSLIGSSKSSILLDGPTGTGKTLIVKEVAKEMSIPMIIRSSTMYSAAGYKGSDLTEMLTGLLEKTGGNLELAERGIVVLDEFDKLGGNSNSELEMRKAVQQELLTYLSGAKFPIEYKGKSYEFDTSKITFICLGAFTDMRERKINEELDENGQYKMMPEDYIQDGLLREVVGRFSLITATKSLSKENLIKILKDSEISPLVQLQSMGREIYGVDITYSDEIVEKIAEDALAEDTGARALQTVVNGIRNVVLSDLISKGQTQIEINDEVLEKSKEIYTRDGGKVNELRI